MPDDLIELERDLSRLIRFGWGEVIIRVDRGKVVGHDVKLSRKYGKFTTKK